MAVLASDDFNRANESPLASPWVSTGFLVDCDLISNAVSYPVMDNNNKAMLRGGITWPDDQYSKAALNCVSTGGVRQGPALYVRYVGGGVDTCYRFSTDHAASTNCNVSRFITGNRTTIVDFTQAWSDGDIWELRVSGPASAARLQTFLNGVQKSDTTDNSSLVSGSPGIGVSGNSTITSWSVDTWEGGSPGQTLLPDADVAAGGWTTSPLFSKVNDSSDATIITATAS